uniref:Uncharacterized protein n=1 Tax=Aegilops tauschii subsp. strangulata TaxID=200361 RepID=A0A453PXI4_AEGTS
YLGLSPVATGAHASAALSHAPARRPRALDASAGRPRRSGSTSAASRGPVARAPKASTAAARGSAPARLNFRRPTEAATNGHERSRLGGAQPVSTRACGGRHRHPQAPARCCWRASWLLSLIRLVRPGWSWLGCSTWPICMSLSPRVF